MCVRDPGKSKSPFRFLLGLTAFLAVSALASSGCAKKEAIAPDKAPTADFSGTPRSGSSPLEVEFTDQSQAGSSSISSWLWTFGDGATSASPNPNHFYSDSGTYTVTLRVASTAGADTASKVGYITVGAPAVVGVSAAFSGTPVNGLKPLTVQFTDQSTSTSGPIASWAWSFGDQGTSTQQNPSHTYTSAGHYSVTLTASSAVQSGTVTKPEYITVREGPTAEFLGTPRSGTQPLTVQFTDQSIPGTSTITSWSWTFGDGGTSTAQSPSHVYQNNGTYTVGLTVVTADGSATETKLDYIVVGAATPPTAAFAGAPTSGEIPLAVQFTDQSTAGTYPITGWHWEFGDLATSTSQNPSHTYANPGKYSVLLTVSSSFGSDAITKFDYITALAPKVAPTAAFSGSPTSGLVPLGVQFTDQSSPGSAPITSWLWAFGDGSTSTSQSPAHTYNLAGTYDVSLTVTTADGTNSTTKVGYITVNPRVGPTAAFSGAPTSGLQPLTVQFTDQSVAGTSPISSWLWTFGDGGTSTAKNPSHVYNAAGTYTVSLTVTTADGTNALTKTNYITVNPRVGPTAAFTGSPTTGLLPLIVQFTDQSVAGTSTITSRLWNFGDDSTATTTNPKHTYQLAGKYTVTLTVTTADGSDGETKVDYITVTAPVPVPPTADFSAVPTSGPAPLAVQFTDHSTPGTQPITAWLWSFGDGGTSTAQNPSHTYAAPDSYTVALTVTTLVGSDTATKTKFIAVCTKPVADFTSDVTSGFAPLTVQFSDSSAAGSSATTSWLWSFGDGGTSAEQNPTHVYTTPGTYDVSLTAGNACGTATVTKPAYVTAQNPCDTAPITLVSATWTNLQIQAGETCPYRARLNWNADTQQGCSRSVFGEVSYRAVGDTTWTVLGQSVCYTISGTSTTDLGSFIVTGLPSGTYQFQVVMFDCNGTEPRASLGPTDDADLDNRCYVPRH